MSVIISHVRMSVTVRLLASDSEMQICTEYFCINFKYIFSICCLFAVFLYICAVYGQYVLVFFLSMVILSLVGAGPIQFRCSNNWKWLNKPAKKTKVKIKVYLQPHCSYTSPRLFVQNITFLYLRIRPWTLKDRINFYYTIHWH